VQRKTSNGNEMIRNAIAPILKLNGKVISIADKTRNKIMPGSVPILFF
jgi:hypothetical protein